MAASTKKVTSLFRDLRQGNAKKREAAARALAETDPAGAREVLLAALAETKKTTSRAVIVRALHWVLDADAARLILANDEFVFQPERVSADVLAELCDDARRELALSSPDDVEDRLARLGLMGETVTRPASLDLGAWKESLVDLFLAVIDDQRLLKLRSFASRGIRQLDLRRGNEALLVRWEAEPMPERAFEAYAAWIRLGCPVNAENRADRMLQLYESLIDELRSSPPLAIESDFDPLFATSTAVVPEAFVADLLLAVIQQRNGFPQTKTSLAKRHVELTRRAGGLVLLFEDRRFEACHAFAAAALAESEQGARAVLARSDRVSRAVLATALARLPAREAYDFVAPRLAENGEWYAAVLAEPKILRDPRWIDLAQKTSALEDKGRALFLVVARDPQNESRARAVQALSQAAERATDRIERRYALHALGQSGHPNATPALIAALDDPGIGDAVPLVCTALGECGDTRAIKILETRLKGPHKSFVQSALDFIRGRMTQIHADVLLAACQDDDVVIADLARRARDGDADSAIVLEDALRERGRL